MFGILIRAIFKLALAELRAEIIRFAMILSPQRIRWIDE